jgi:Family of unknown function (DUF5522)
MENQSNKPPVSPPALEEGVDYYLENGFLVFTEHYLKTRGYCCRSGCRHCPYGFKYAVQKALTNSL